MTCLLVQFQQSSCRFDSVFADPLVGHVVRDGDVDVEPVALRARLVHAVCASGETATTCTAARSSPHQADTGRFYSFP